MALWEEPKTASRANCNSANISQHRIALVCILLYNFYVIFNVNEI